MVSSFEIETIKAIAGEAEVSPVDAWEAIQASGVQAVDFAEEGPRKVFAAMAGTLEKGERIDHVVFIRRVQNSSLTDSEVASWLTETHHGVIAQRLAFLKDQSKRRQSIEQMRAVAGMLKDVAIPVEVAAAELQKAIESMRSASLKIDNLQSDFFGFLDELDEIRAQKREPILKTGIDTLDAAIGGLRPTLTVIGALPGVGKSALCTGIMRNLTQRGVKSGLLSLEDERRFLTRRLTADASGVPLFVLTTRPTTQRQAEQIADASESVHDMMQHIFVDDTQGLEIGEVVSRARQMVAQGCKAIFIDHFGEILMKASERQDLEIADALVQLRAISKTYRVPVVVFAHLRRRIGLSMTDAPQLTDFFGGSAFEKKARVALGLFCFKKDESDEGEASLDKTRLGCVVMKQTEGPSGLALELKVNASAAIVTHSPLSARQLAEIAAENGHQTSAMASNSRPNSKSAPTPAPYLTKPNTRPFTARMELNDD